MTGRIPKTKIYVTKRNLQEHKAGITNILRTYIEMDDALVYEDAGKVMAMNDNYVEIEIKEIKK